MADFVEVVDAGRGWTQVRDAEGNVYKLEGARNWRNNNPGNIEYGDFAKSLGAVGSDGRFAVFPSYDAGRQAKERLIFSSPSYRDLTLEQAISRYAPPNENNTRAYVNQVAAAAGVPASTPMSQIPTQVRGNVLNAMERVEGFKPGRTYNAEGVRLPPAEIPNVVATQLDTQRPVTSRVPPNPVAMSPDLSLMRNPQMSSAAMNAQVTPSANTPLPRPRPSAPDIVTPSMASLNAQRPNVNATRAGDMLAASPTPYTPRLTDAGDNIYSYHIPKITPTTITGGLGSLTPSAPRPQAAQYPPARLPEIPPSNLGQPPITRSVPSVPMRGVPTQAEIDRAPGQVIATYPTRPMGSAPNNIIDQRAEQLGLRPPSVPARLMPGVAVQNYDVGINGPAGITRPQFSALPFPSMRPAIATANVPFPRARPQMPTPQRASVPQRIAPQPMARMAQATSPLRVVVNGANSYGAPSQGQGQSAPRQIQGYVNDGNGKLTSTETGGVYYERHLR